MLFVKKHLSLLHERGGKKKKKEKKKIGGTGVFFLFFFPFWLFTRDISIEYNKYFVYMHNTQRRAHVNFGIHNKYERERERGGERICNRGLAR